MCLSRSKKNNVYPCKPQFYYIKVGFKGVKLYRHVFLMEREKERTKKNIIKLCVPTTITLHRRALKFAMFAYTLRYIIDCGDSSDVIRIFYRTSVTAIIRRSHGRAAFSRRAGLRVSVSSNLLVTIDMLF